MGKTRWKVVSPKKLSVRKRRILETARILSSGETLSLPSGEIKGQMKMFPCLHKAGYECERERAEFNICKGCPVFSTTELEREMDAEDEAEDREVEFIFKHFPVK